MRRFALSTSRIELEQFLTNGRDADIAVSEILDWRNFSMRSAINLQNEGKKILPMVNVPKTRLKGYNRISDVKRPSGGKFGCDTLLFSPPSMEGEEPANVEVSSYLNVHKGKPSKSKKGR